LNVPERIHGGQVGRKVKESAAQTEQEPADDSDE
jgi:hypothetical protein